MADLEKTLADISFIIIRNDPCATDPITLPDPSVHFVMERHLQERDLLNFDTIFAERIGYRLFERYIFDNGSKFSIKCIMFHKMISEYKGLDSTATRKPIAKLVYNEFIMPDLLAMDHPFGTELALFVNDCLSKDETDPNLFNDYISSINKHFRQNEFHKFKLSPHFTRYLQWKFIEINSKITKEDFAIHRIIGRGGFGEVYGCRKIDTGHMCAIKYLYKKRLKLRRKEKMAFLEREMLLKFDSPFIVGLNYAFQTEDKLCFVLDLMNGGDLGYHLRQRGQFSEEETRFYAAEMILGLEHIHSKNVVYRDLKPANVLMDDAGHIRISDLGLATDCSKKLPNENWGTPGYKAPEVVESGKSYNCCADWFSFGCTLVKLLTGKCPPTLPADPSFSQNVEVFSETFSTELVSLISGLLQFSPESRLGYNGASEIKKHCWFQSIDWTLALKLGLDPPFTPPKGEVHAADPVDIGTFDDKDIKAVTLTREDEEFFKSFDVFPSERWQREILGNSTLSPFDNANQNADRTGLKRRKSCNNFCGAKDALECKCILEGYMEKLGGMFLTKWQRNYFNLYPDKFEWRPDPYTDTATNTIYLDKILAVRNCTYKNDPLCISLDVMSRMNKTSSPDLILLKCETEMEFDQWNKCLTKTLEEFRYKTKQDSLKILKAETEIEGGWALVESFENLENSEPPQIIDRDA